MRKINRRGRKNSFHPTLNLHKLQPPHRLGSVKQVFWSKLIEYVRESFQPGQLSLHTPCAQGMQLRLPFCQRAALEPLPCQPKWGYRAHRKGLRLMAPDETFHRQ